MESLNIFRIQQQALAEKNKFLLKAAVQIRNWYGDLEKYYLCSSSLGVF